MEIYVILSIFSECVAYVKIKKNNTTTNQKPNQGIFQSLKESKGTREKSQNLKIKWRLVKEIGST